MKIKDLSKKSIIDITRHIIGDAIGRNASAIRVRIGEKELEVFEKNGKDGAMAQTARVEMNLSASIIARLKIMSELSISEHRRVQVGSYDFRFGGSPPIGRKVRVIAIPDLNGKEEVVIDLAHN